MNDIGFGILCFGDDYYFKGAKEKENKILQAGFNCVILTDKPNEFFGHFIYYERELRSYHDKMILPKDILLTNDICILIDADTQIDDYSFLEDLKTYKFKEGISYIETLADHPEEKSFVKELNLNLPEWQEYTMYASSILPSFFNLPLMWEYFLVINPTHDTNLRKFMIEYEKLQVVKEFCDIRSENVILGNGEGVSISIAAELSKTPCQRDYDLYNLIAHKMSNFSKKWMR